jgi:hypothetical protein
MGIVPVNQTNRPGPRSTGSTGKLLDQWSVLHVGDFAYLFQGGDDIAGQRASGRHLHYRGQTNSSLRVVQWLERKRSILWSTK